MAWMNVATPSNEGSWSRILEFAKAMPDPTWTKWKGQVVPILNGAIDLRMNAHFLAGQSMQHLLFSTMDRYGLDDEPRVTISYDANMDLFAAYTTYNIWFSPPPDQVQLTAQNGVQLFVALLRRLWIETRPDHPLPASFA